MLPSSIAPQQDKGPMTEQQSDQCISIAETSVDMETTKRKDGTKSRCA